MFLAIIWIINWQVSLLEKVDYSYENGKKEYLFKSFLLKSKKFKREEIISTSKFGSKLPFDQFLTDTIKDVRIHFASIDWSL